MFNNQWSFVVFGFYRMLHETNYCMPPPNVGRRWEWYACASTNRRSLILARYLILLYFCTDNSWFMIEVSYSLSSSSLLFTWRTDNIQYPVLVLITDYRYNIYVFQKTSHARYFVINYKYLHDVLPCNMKCLIIIKYIQYVTSCSLRLSQYLLKFYHCCVDILAIGLAEKVIQEIVFEDPLDDNPRSRLYRVFSALVKEAMDLPKFRDNVAVYVLGGGYQDFEEMGRQFFSVSFVHISYSTKWNPNPIVCKVKVYFMLYFCIENPDWNIK